MEANYNKEKIVNFTTVDLRKLAVKLLSEGECPTYILKELILRNYEK